MALGQRSRLQGDLRVAPSIHRKRDSAMSPKRARQLRLIVTACVALLAIGYLLSGVVAAGAVLMVLVVLSLIAEIWFRRNPDRWSPRR